jgi:hypothetical protein
LATALSRINYTTNSASGQNENEKYAAGKGIV